MWPVTFKGNVLESERRYGAWGEPGAWWGVQNTLSCVDLDDGGTRWHFVDNVCIANGTAGYKLGHDVDRITYRNNIVVATTPAWAHDGLPGWTMTDIVPITIGQQPKYNRNVYAANVMVRLSQAPTTPHAHAHAHDISRGPWLVSNFNSANTSMMRHVPYSAWDNNTYWAETDNVTFMQGKASWHAAGLDRHSLFDVDPMILNARREASTDWPFGIRLADASPALGRPGGFVNFAYGPRNRNANGSGSGSGSGN